MYFELFLLFANFPFSLTSRISLIRESTLRLVKPPLALAIAEAIMLAAMLLSVGLVLD
jgi:hypothetical protein